MARRILPTTVALTASAVLLLSACGGESAKDPDDIKGADKGASDSAKPSKAPEAAGAGRPEVTLPKSFALEFQGWSSSDPVEQAILDDGKEQVRAGYAAIIADDPDDDAFAFYNTQAALGQGKQWIKTYTDKNLTVIGELPAFEPNVKLLGKSGAVLSYCTDEIKAATKNRKTGEEVGNPKGTDPKVRYTTTLRKNSKGVWQTHNVDSERGAC